ncbi:MAG: bifunctional diaminohydroxyphosphoribosylaminopyrimidine deaminase/5-amino-6-(5-phosphoribosylamino)uracil reductase RibD [Desulfobulbus sp.]|nr:bifunctional diaminohydroxyphosphoribosylaminopyrimidine deaminase/5-amino-6-(5-phosphoribosylamino)uracil reductase RibD [Desulfobulbus sp.]
MHRDDAYYIGLALEEARKGEGRTSPNPAVGAIVVDGEGMIIGRGYHHKAGTPHAEVHALRDAGGRARGASLYVTLEPCNHQGLTPPCTQAVLAAGVSTVVVGMPDPNPDVAGGGSQYLRSMGVQVRSGVLETQCRELNLPFIKHSTTGLPWIIMKAGLSLDGRITFCPGEAGTVTGPQASRYTHTVRNRVDAILVGVGTILIDDPSLTTRLEGVEGTRDPLRVILDSSLRLPVTARVLRQTSAAATWVCCGQSAQTDREKSLTRAGARVLRLPLDSAGRVELVATLRLLAQANVTSVLVEGGATVHGAFLSQRHVDELLLLYAPIVIGDQGTPLVRGYGVGERASALLPRRFSVQELGVDFLFRGFFRD